MCVVSLLLPRSSGSGSLVHRGWEPSRKNTFTLFSIYGHRGALPDKDFGTGASGPVARRCRRRGPVARRRGSQFMHLLRLRTES